MTFPVALSYYSSIPARGPTLHHSVERMSKAVRATSEGASVTKMPTSLSRSWVEEQGQDVAARKSDTILDFADTKTIDSAGLAFIWTLHESFQEAESRLVFRNIKPHLLKMLEEWKGPRFEDEAPKAAGSFFESLGETALSGFREFKSALSVMVEMLYWSSFGLRKRRDFRRGILGQQMYLLGYKALGIVVLLSFLIGIVLALQSAMFLRDYGAGIFLASMIGWSMIREFGPLMTAIILAGRTGSATTAEIATMVVGEEIDALRTMGINPVQFVVVPKLWAITITMPLLSIIASATGILGGYFVSLLYLDISSGMFWNELGKWISLRDFNAGFLKSVVFSWLIIWVGSYYGFKVRGGAEEVGKETTASVVAAIFVIILADAIFSFVLP